MQDLTTGSITRHLLKTTSFMLVSMVFQTLYFLVDLYWVGHLGKEAVAGVGVAGNLTFIVLAITQMLGVGTTTLVSHAVGTKDKERATLVFNQSLTLGAVVAVIFLVIGMAVRTTYAEALSADRETARLAAEYLLWFIPAMALQFGIVGMGAALRGTGNFKPGMIVQTATVILNMLCAPFLIFGWGTGYAMGVAGAAVATLIAVFVACIWLSTYFFDVSAYLHFRRTLWKPRFGLWRDMLKVGLPASPAGLAPPLRRGSASVCVSSSRGSCRSSRSALPSRRLPVRTSAPAAAIACSRRSARRLCSPPQ
jgi:putative MATE family efflux protein